jgi:hypothetical protein
MRRCTLRGHKNILKRLLIHIGAFNISLILRDVGRGYAARTEKPRAARLLLHLFKWLACHYRPNGAVESCTTPVLALFGAYRSRKTTISA